MELHFLFVFCLVSLKLTKELAEMEGVLEEEHCLKERKQICQKHTNCELGRQQFCQII